MICIRNVERYIVGNNLLYVLFGNDSYSVREALREINLSLSNDFFNTEVLEGEKISINEFNIACETVPFLSDKRVVVVNGLLERFEVPKKQSRVKRPSRVNQVKEWQSFADTINTLPETTILILIDGDASHSNPLVKAISEKGTIKQFNLLKYRELIGWIKERIKNAGGAASPAAVEALAKLVGSDLWTLSNEIAKLISYTDGNVIQEIDVNNLVSNAQESSVFVLVDAVLSGKASVAQEIVRQLLNNGAAPNYLLTMLSRQIRLAVLTKDMLRDKKTESTIQFNLNLPDYPFRKTMEQARKYSFEQLKVFYEKLLETDISLKTGKISDKLALNILVVELCQR